MKFEREIITLTLGEGDDAAVLKFDRLKDNVFYKITGGLSTARKSEEALDQLGATFDYKAAVFDACFSVENLADSDGPVTLERLKAQDIYPKHSAMIIAGYFAAINIEIEEPEAEEKNES